MTNILRVSRNGWTSHVDLRGGCGCFDIKWDGFGIGLNFCLNDVFFHLQVQDLC